MDGTSLWDCRRFDLPGLAMVLLAGGATLLSSSSAWAEPKEPADVRVARLVRDLGARDFAERESADEALRQLGPQTRAALEQAARSDDPEVRLRAARLLERLQLESVWAPGDGSLQCRGLKASEVLAKLAAQSGNHIHIGDPYGTFTDKVLENDYPDASYWEVIDDICRKTGNRIRPHYDMHTPGIVVSAGALGNYPRAYSGPVRAQIISARREFVEELSYEEHKAELRHNFQFVMQLTWEDRFRLVGYSTQPELVEAVTDVGGVVTAAHAGSSGWNATTRGLRQVNATMKFNPIPVAARKLDRLKIKWGLIAMGEPAMLEISDLMPGARAARDDVALSIEAIDKQSSAKCVVTLNVARDLAMPEPSEVVFQEYEAELLDREGRAYRVQTSTPAFSDRGVQLKVTFLGETPESEPAKLRLHYPRLRARREVEIVFRDVPLPVGRPE